MKLFKYTLSILLMASLVLLLPSCGDDDPDVECNISTATGTINGKAFNFSEGRASDIDNELSLTLFSNDVTIDNVCTFSGNFGDDAVSIFGSIPNVGVGRTELFLSADLSEGVTLTMFDAEDFTNVIATEGFFEVTEVTETSIIGYLNISGSGDNICGTFVLEKCN